MRPAGILLTLVTVLTLAACTDDPVTSSPTESSSTTTAPTTTVTTLTPPEAIEEFRLCLAANGVDIDSIPLDANGHPRLDLALRNLDFDDEMVAEAMSTCAGILGSGALSLGQEEILRSVVMDRLTGFSECMRRNGVEGFPDPVSGFTGVGSPFPMAEIPYEDPGLTSAVEICQAEVLGDLPGSG